MSYENFSWAKTSVALSQVLKQLKKQLNIAKEAIKQRLIDVRITWLSNYKKLKLDTWNWTPRDRVPIYNGNRTEWSPKDLSRILLQCVRTIALERGWDEVKVSFENEPLMVNFQIFFEKYGE